MHTEINIEAIKFHSYMKGLYIQFEVTIKLEQSHSNGNIVRGHKINGKMYRDTIKEILGYICNAFYFDTALQA